MGTKGKKKDQGKIRTDRKYFKYHYCLRILTGILTTIHFSDIGTYNKK